MSTIICPNCQTPHSSPAARPKSWTCSNCGKKWNPFPQPLGVQVIGIIMCLVLGFVVVLIIKGGIPVSVR